VRVPEDISVTGFDDIELAMVTEPGLTTVHVPHREMGRLAADRLLGVLRRDGKLESAELKTEIRLRRSLGPVLAD
jgi:LacI family transcriptional regulator